MKDYRNYCLRILAIIIDGLGWLLFFWLPRPKIEPSRIKKLLILKFDRLGDTFLSEPTIVALRRIFPQAQLVVACSFWNRGVLVSNPAIDQIVCLPSLPDIHHSHWRDFLRLANIKRIGNLVKEQQPEVVIDLQGNPLNVLAMFKSGVKYRVGYGTKVASFLLTEAAYYRGDWPQTKIYFSLTRLFNYSQPLTVPKIYAGQDDIKKVSSFIQANNCLPFIVFHLGAGRSYRQWPVRYFAAIANRLIIHYPQWKIVVVGGQEDQKLYDSFILSVDRPEKIISAIGEFDIPALDYFLGQAQLFIGNDSGPGHLAAAQGTPVISLMNPWSGIERWQARGPQVSLFYKSAHHCRGIRCHLDPCPNMAAITIDEVWAAVQQHLTLC